MAKLIDRHPFPVRPEYPLDKSGCQHHRNDAEPDRGDGDQAPPTLSQNIAQREAKIHCEGTENDGRLRKGKVFG